MLQETTLFGKQQIKTSITLLKILLNGLDSKLVSHVPGQGFC